ncbi:VanZ family protein [Heyndrickxia oleronia]|nr:VanZ family protein [Heyndrickxia oleronia]MEC1372963.1 VanZ family protein [Heyndrickxia oleronia]
MMSAKLRKLIFAGTILYTILILYFLFLAFNRLEHATNYGYEFLLIPEYPPLTFPRLSFGWIYDFGNIAAFIPFGVFIPLLYRVSFKKFIFIFILIILVLETLQSLTFLGTFDVDDVISNTLGAAIGFCAYKVGFSSKVTLKKLMLSILSIGVFLIGIMVISESINFALKKRESPIQALNDVKEMTGNLPMIENLQSFTVAGKIIEPKMNVYTSKGKNSTKYIYMLGNKKDVTLYSYFGFSDNDDHKGEVTIIADGNVRAQYDGENFKTEVTLIIPFEKVNKITIIVSGNAKLWDVGFSEMKHWWE